MAFGGRCGGKVPANATASRARPADGIARRWFARRGHDPQDLAVEQREILGGVVGVGVAAGINAGVAHRDVQEPVATDLQIATVVVLVVGGDVVDQHDLAVGIDGVAGHREPAGSVDASARRCGGVRVVEVEESVGLEVLVDGNAQQAALASVARRDRKGQCRRRQQHIVADQTHRPGLHQIQHGSVGQTHDPGGCSR